MTERWQNADKGEVNKTLLPYVAEVERAQFDIFDRFVKFDALYDPYYSAADRGIGGTASRRSIMVENLIASNVDTVTAVIATAGVRARFIPDGGDWSTQRKCRRMELYADGLNKLLGLEQKSQRAFHDSALKGMGFVKIYPDHDRGEVCAERVMVDDIIVDEKETRGGRTPRQMHQRWFVDREELKGMFPDSEDEIDNVPSGGMGDGARWADYRPFDDDHEVVVIESWFLARGKPGTKSYKPGRHVICIEGHDLDDKPWDKNYFPFAVAQWSERNGFYAIGLAHRIIGHQRKLDKINWQVDMQQDHLAVPTTYTGPADAGLTVKTTNRVGAIVVTKTGNPPTTVIPRAVSGEVYSERERTKESAYEESGTSRAVANSKKPAGLKSGAALREWRDQTTQRFASQEGGYEDFRMMCTWLALAACKELGDRAPEIHKDTRFGQKYLKWSDVDLEDAKLRMQPASDITKTPAGRTELAMEWAQAGVISRDDALRLARLPDTEHVFSLYNAALEDIEASLEESLDGNVLIPEPYQNLAMGIWRYQQMYLDVRHKGAPDEILEGLRQWIEQAVAMEQIGQPLPAANPDLVAGPMSAAPSMAPPSQIPPPAPPGAAPMAAGM